MTPEASYPADTEEARALEKMLAEGRRALEYGRSHVVVIGDARSTPILIRSLADELGSEFETVVVTLGDRDPDSARARVDDAIRHARPAGATDGAVQLALMLPEALAIPAASLRALDEPGPQGRARRLVLFVDRDATAVEDPARELVARLGVGMSKIELEPARRPLVRGPDPERADATAGEGTARPEPRAPQAPLGPPQVSAPRRRRVRPIAVRPRGRGTGVRASLRWAAVVVLAGAGLFTFAPGIVRQAPAEPHAAAVATREAATQTPTPSEPEPTRADEPEKAALPAPPSAKPLPPVGVPRQEPAPSVAEAGASEVAGPAHEPAPSTAPAPGSQPEPADAKPAPILIGVNFNARPWAELEVDGRSLGATPVADVRLAPGEHTVVATFPDGRVSRRKLRVDALQNRFRID